MDYRSYLAEQFQDLVAPPTPPPAAPPIPTIEHAGELEDVVDMPAYLMPCHEHGHPRSGRYSCCFCGVGDSGTVLSTDKALPTTSALSPGPAEIKLRIGESIKHLPAEIHEADQIEVFTSATLVPAGGLLHATLVQKGAEQTLIAREFGSHMQEDGQLKSQHFARYTPAISMQKSAIKYTNPTGGCAKLKLSMVQQRPAYPIHITPSYLDRTTGERHPITYEEGIRRLADLLLAHRAPVARSLVYASGQLDYFTIFAMQEVFRLLGVRNLTGNAEHCLNSGAVHNQILTGQEGPFLTIDQSINGPGRFFIMSGWNGYITHPPVFHQLTKRQDLDGYLIEVMVTESAKVLAGQLGAERILLIKSCGDTHLALSVAHQLLHHHPDAIEHRFVEHFADKDSFHRFCEYAQNDYFKPQWVAPRIAAEPRYTKRLEDAIYDIAAKFADPAIVPINMPSVGLSQTTGVVAHCLWGSTMALVGKYGLKPDATPAGGTLRVPGQINAESEVQGLSRNYFMGRLPVDKCATEVCRRMGLPDDGYAKLFEDTPRAALDYSEPTPGTRELFLCVGTHFESNMMNRTRWVEKLQHPETTLVVIDPIVDTFSLKHADLIIPPPPHPAVTKLYQNGEWKLTLSIPQKRPAPETRSDPTILYDVMAHISKRIRTQPALATAHPDLAKHTQYMRQRFEAPTESDQAPITGPFTRDFGADGLVRVEGEVSRAQLYERILNYMNGGKGRTGPLYCRFEHGDGRLVTWEELLRKGSVIYGGVGTTRYVLDYDTPDHHPFGDLFQRPGQFTFFVPTPDDLSLPEGIILNSGRSSLSDDSKLMRWAISTFNSGKGTPITNMPDKNILHISQSVCERLGIQDGDQVQVTNGETGHSLVLTASPSHRVKGESCYVSFHKTKAEMEDGCYINILTSHTERCPYSAQTKVKATIVTLTLLPSAPTHAPQVDFSKTVAMDIPLHLGDLSSWKK